MICLDCQGEGKIEYIECFKPASECCGGCYTKETCPTCYSFGKVWASLQDEFGLRLEKLIQKASVNRSAHEKLIEKLEELLFEQIKYEKYR